MIVTGGLEDIKKVSMLSVSTLNLEKESSYHTVRQILANENAITSWVDSHGHERRKKWSNRNNLLDEQLRLWALKMWKRGLYLTETVIMEKGGVCRAH